MITAKLEPTGKNTWEVSFSFPHGMPPANKTVRSIAEADRMLYFYTRNYIYSKISHWLAQRGVALSATGDYKRLAHLKVLRDYLSQFQYASYSKLCRAIYQVTNQLVLLSPPEKSRQRKYYDSVIFPILEFCRP